MSKHGISRASMRVRLAVAAAVLAGGGAAGVVVVSASHGSAASAESAGFVQQASGRSLSYTSALSSAVKGWSKSPSESLMTISHMKPVTNYWTQAWHRAVIFIQRGTVVATGRGEFAVKSANGTVEIWHVNSGTKTLNIGGTSTGLSAMTGGTMKVPAQRTMNTKVKGVAKGDLVFVFGERENRTLKAQLVLFAVPMTAKPMAAPTATATMPAATATATMPAATPTATATMPAATPAATTPVVTPTGTSATFSGNNS